jgi:hypothetical protein
MAIPFKPQANGLAGLGLGLRWAGCKAALAGEHSNLGLMASRGSALDFGGPVAKQLLRANTPTWG